VPRSGERFPASIPSSTSRRFSPASAGGSDSPSAAARDAAPEDSTGDGPVAPATAAAGLVADFAAKLAAREAAGSTERADPAGEPVAGAVASRSAVGREERRANDTARRRGREVREPGRRERGVPEDALRWHAAETIPETIRATLAEGLAYANWLVDRAREHPEFSVHEYRKTVRRMRAIVRLLRHLIGPRAYRSLDTGLRSAVAPTSGLRDARILLCALERVAPRGGGEGLRERLAAEWGERVARLEAHDEEARVLAASRAPLARIAGELQSVLPPTLSAADLRDAVAKSYRKLRRTFREAVESGEDVRIHAARKRAKELRYQLEWLALVSGKRVRRRWKRLSAIAQDLGEVTDLFILERAVLAHAPPGTDTRGEAGAASAGAATFRDVAAAPFAARIRERAEARWQELVEAHRDLFDERPGDFARGVAKRV